jgi:NADP-dependent 3-hydroxy acid dehydrogenase YdfG
VQGADVDEWRQMVEVNLLGLLYCTHAALPIMRDTGGGDIVNVSSVAGRQASLGSAVYNMTKWGVNGFTEGLRQEALHVGVRASVVEPGMVATELLDHNKNPIVIEAAEKMMEQVGTPLSADDIARAILYVVGQPPHVAINEVLVRPSRQQR